jgi:ectoine hydroxylase-related dioxygenase (phytanoyl-CoA dioxygenase family)
LPITDAQVAEWHEHGYVLVPDFLSGEQLDAARDNAYRYFPTAAEYYAAPQRYKNLPRDAQFPFAGDALNNISTGAELVGAARRIVGSDDVFLTQSLLWAKYAGRGDWEQPHHVDYQNNSLVVPSDAPGFRQTGSILYLEDVTLELGPTYLVPRGASRGQSLVPAAPPADDVPHLYRAERPVLAKAGTIMLYDMQTFHRGSGLRAAQGIRLTFHNVFRAAGCEWMGWRAWPHEGLTAEMRRFVEQATPEQLGVIGFPRPGHPYWNEQTLAGVQARYPRLDMSVFRAAVASRHGAAAGREVA